MKLGNKRYLCPWQPRLEIRAKTVKTRVNLVPRIFSLSNMAAADRPGQHSLTSVERPSCLRSDFVNVWRHARLVVPSASLRSYTLIWDHSPFLGTESSFYRRWKINKYTRGLPKTRRGRLDFTLLPYEDYSITQDDSPRMTRWRTITWRELLHETPWLDEDDSTRVTRRGWLDEGTTRRGRLGEDHTTRQDDSTRLLWVIREGHLFCELFWRVYLFIFFNHLKCSVYY